MSLSATLEKLENAQPVPEKVRAAQYVRMSTEHQRYSTQNQAEAIQEYAARRNIEIVQTYADEGKSGLRLAGRDALKRLIEDVQNGSADFSMILVFDVSRWGRFQDADESAYYEYICRRAGYTVQYCAEQFENDGSPVATIVKGVKRAMAGEYSRELSAKVFAGQCRLIELGYRQGGPAGFGLRRRLIGQDGTEKGDLSRGEHKSLQTDRVILVPGPPDEIETVRWIYESFVNDGVSEHEIAAILNQRQVLTDLRRPWTKGTVHQVLINEKYIGANVWNRISYKLKKKRVLNSPDMWIRADDAFEPIVDRALFAAAQVIIRTRSCRISNEEMLDGLKVLLEQKGYLSGLIIDETDALPSSSAYRTRFGSLIQAYRLIGFAPEHDYEYLEINRQLRGVHGDLVAQAVRGIEAIGGLSTLDPETDLIVVNGEFATSIVIARCRRTFAGSLRWNIRFDVPLQPDVTVVVRMDPDNTSRRDYFIFPMIDLCTPRVRLTPYNGIALDAYRFDTLDQFFDMAARTRLNEVA
jgi:DNA invertase Pin-like site-specific DNA recombinase